AAAAQAALQSIQQKVQAAEADAEFAQNEYQRLLALEESRFVSTEQLQQAKSTAARAQAILRSARFDEEVAAHELAAAQTRLQISTASSNGQKPAERVAVRSPVNGAVLALVRQSEGVIQAGEPILEVGDPGALEVVVEVLSFDAVKLEPGLGVRLSGWGGPVLEATVRRIEPIGFEDVSALGVEEQRVQVIADMVSPREQWRQLGDGYRVDADFILWQSEDTLQVPTSAIFEYNGASAVFMVESETARHQTVTTGPSNGLMTQVTQGLQEGVRVVRHPGRGLEDGDQVRVR
ncbi:MAG: HlyD family efflux transporter periplasmic adaptor subunit, partial [Pseudomonadota bacterium]|nr:HlyD family efflux transporter periplasmic adaptor subunit [Pseudomonadota bacterium]